MKMGVMKVGRHRRELAILVGLVVLGSALVGWTLVRSQRATLGCLPPMRSQSLAVGMSSEEQKTVMAAVGSSVVPGQVYVTTEGGKFFAGGGEPFRWQLRSSSVPGYVALALPSGHRDTLYEALDNLSRSTNGGRTWAHLSCRLILVSQPVWVSPRNPRVIYLAANTGDGVTGTSYGGFYSTRDGGRTWGRTLDSAALDAVAAAAGNPRDVTVSAPDGGVLRSRDGGQHWSSGLREHLSGLKGPQVLNLSYGPGLASFLWAASQQGVFRRSGSGQWSAAGLRGVYVSSVVPDARLSQTAFAVILDRGARRTTDGGKTWHRMSGLPSSITGVNVQALGDVVYAWGGRAIYRSNNHGKTWSRLSPLPRG